MTTTEYADFTRAICSAPDDDTPRLVFADWLEENGEVERAEFIRVQCDLYRLEEAERELLNSEVDWSACTGIAARWCPNCGDCCCRNPEDSMNDDDCPLHSPTSPHCCLDNLKSKLYRKRVRESELLLRDAVARRLAEVGLKFPWSIGNGLESSPVGTNTQKVLFRRGFVESVTCHIGSWLSVSSRMCWHLRYSVEEVSISPFLSDVTSPRVTRRTICPPTAQPITKAVLVTSISLGEQAESLIRSIWPWIQFEFRSPLHRSNQ